MMSFFPWINVIMFLCFKFSFLHAGENCKEVRHAGLGADKHLKIYNDTFAAQDLFIRPLFPEDVTTALLKTYASQDAMKYYGSGTPFIEEDVRKHFQERAYKNLWSACESWAVIAFDGVVGKVDAFSADFPDESKKELACCIAQEYSNKGFATSALKLIVHNFNDDFIATSHPQNYGSRAVLEKLGFKKDLNRQGVIKFGQIRDYYFHYSSKTTRKQKLGSQNKVRAKIPSSGFSHQIKSLQKNKNRVY